MIKIIYDGQCPFCSYYAKMVRLKKTVGDVQLINARDFDSNVLDRYKEQGYNIDEGMLVEYQNQIYYGSDAMHIISLLSNKNGLMNTIVSKIFSYKKISRVIYPFLKFGRAITLKFLGNSKIHN